MKFIKFKSVKSTNDKALKFIKKNNLTATLISAKIQTNGRGTMGKKWISSKGNLFISIFFQIDQKKINFKQYAILNAFIIKKAISSLIDRKIKIKWPNDIMFKNKKICGILQEVINYNEKNFLIVGIGLNTNVTPKNKSFSSSSLKNIVGKNINNNEVLKNIKTKYEKFLSEIKRFSYFELKKKYK